MSERVPYWNAWMSLDLWHLSRIAEAIARAAAAAASTLGRRVPRATPQHGVGLSTPS